MIKKEVEFSARPQGKMVQPIFDLVYFITNFKTTYYTLKTDTYSPGYACWKILTRNTQPSYINICKNVYVKNK